MSNLVGRYVPVRSKEQWDFTQDFLISQGCTWTQGRRLVAPVCNWDTYYLCIHIRAEGSILRLTHSRMYHDDVNRGISAYGCTILNLNFLIGTTKLEGVL